LIEQHVVDFLVCLQLKEQSQKYTKVSEFAGGHGNGTATL